MDGSERNAKGTLHSHSAIAPFGSPNTVYAVRSLHFAHPNFAPFHSAKLRISLTLGEIMKNSFALSGKFNRGKFIFNYYDKKRL